MSSEKIPHKERIDIQQMVSDAFDKNRPRISCVECGREGRVTKDAKIPLLRFKCACKKISYTWADMGRLLDLQFDYSYCTNGNKNGFILNSNASNVPESAKNIENSSFATTITLEHFENLDNSGFNEIDEFVLESAPCLSPIITPNQSTEDPNIDMMRLCSNDYNPDSEKESCSSNVNSLEMRIAKLEVDVKEMREVLFRIVDLNGDIQKAFEKIEEKIQKVSEDVSVISKNSTCDINKKNTIHHNEKEQKNIKKTVILKNNINNNKEITNEQYKNQENQKNTDNNENIEKTQKKYFNNYSSDERRQMENARELVTRKRVPNIILRDKNKAYSLRNLTRVYVKGLNIRNNTNPDGLTVSELKQQLFIMRFQLSRIVNISPAGPFYTEFLIFEEYLPSFKTKCISLNFDIDENYDPSTPFNPSASDEIKERIKSKFIARVKNIIDNTSRIEVKDYYTNWLSKYSEDDCLDEKSAQTITEETNSKKRCSEQSITGFSPLKKSPKNKMENEEVGSEDFASPTPSSQ